MRGLSFSTFTPPWLTTDRVRGAAVAVGAFALVAGTGFANGGYFPGPWGWTTLGAAWAAAGALMSRSGAGLSRPALVVSASLALLTLWTALSSFWSVDVTDSALEAERTAVYAAAFLAAVACARLHPEGLLAGTWAAISSLCTWGLLTRLVPDRWGIDDAISVYRLAAPVGYWNSLGLMAAMGALLALGIAARHRSRIVRAVAAASLPLLATTLYFTYSRGAWLALGIGLFAFVALDHARVQLIATAAAALPFTAVAVWSASVQPALTRVGAPLPQQAHEGHRLVVLLAVLSASAGLADLLAQRVAAVPHAAPVRALVGAGGALVAAIVVLFIFLGSPWAIVGRAWHSFSTSTPAASTTTLNGRLFNLYGSGRTVAWHVALEEIDTQPVLGTGAGTYEVSWNRDRPYRGRFRDAHNLYLETLAELGPVGLILLVTAFVLPLAAAGRRRRSPLASTAFAVLLAYGVHAAADWDWEITSVTLAATLCAAFAVGGDAQPNRRPVGWTAIAVASVLGLTGLYTIASRLPMNALDAAIAQAHWNAASADASRAAALAPWSSEPWLHLGEGELNDGLTLSARLAFRTAVRKDRRNWVAWYDLARASVGAERRAALARARALNPLSPEVAAIPL